MGIRVNIKKSVDLPKEATEKEVIALILSDLKGFFHDSELVILRGNGGRPKGSKNKPKYPEAV